MLKLQLLTLRKSLVRCSVEKVFYYLVVSYLVTIINVHTEDCLQPSPIFSNYCIYGNIALMYTVYNLSSFNGQYLYS